VTDAPVITDTEDPRARAAIERYTNRLMENPTPGTTRESARSFVVGLALRADIDRPRNTLEPKSIPASEARQLVVTALEVALVRHAMVQARIQRFARKVAKIYPDMDAATVQQFASARFIDALMTTPPMVEMAAGLLTALLRLKVSRADAPRAVADLLHPEHLDAAVSRGTETSAPTVTVDVPVAFEMHPVKDL
jgi:hypothetical protein